MPVETQKFRFAFISHSHSLCNCARRCLEQEVDCEVEYTVAHWDEEVAAAQRHFASGAEVILCYGGSAQMLSSHRVHSISVVERTDMDIIKALSGIRKDSNKAIVCSVYREERDIEAMRHLLGMDLCPINWVTFTELLEKIDAAFAAGYRYLVGGGLGARHIRKLGGVGIILEPTVASFRLAVENARIIAQQRRDEQARSADLADILKQLDDGMVSVNGNNEIVHWNPNAFRLLGLPPDSRPGVLAPFVETLGLRDVLKDGKTRSELFVRHGKNQYLVSCFPLSARSPEQGAVALFRDVASLQNIGRKISAELYEKGLTPRYHLADIRGNSPAVKSMVHKIHRFAGITASVHIVGETGTGKELAAHALHAASNRRSHPFVVVNCSALAESLLESELYGYDEGAFTGAKRGGKVGLFEMANRGTIFLDEINSISPAVQMRLLRVLEAREIIRVGGDRVLPVDVRIISASNEPLEDLVARGAFRPDLYYRLKVLLLHVPPLRERLEDIPLLLGNTLRRYGKPLSILSPEMFRILAGHTWPGNIRELLSIVESYAVLLDGDAPDESLFRDTFLSQTAGGNPQPGGTPRSPAAIAPPPVGRVLQSMKRSMIKAAVEANNGNRHAAARQLGVSYNTVWRALRGTPIS